MEEHGVEVGGRFTGSPVWFIREYVGDDFRDRPARVH